MITSESPEDDIQDAAGMLDPDNVEEAAKDIKALQKMCAPIDTNAVPPHLALNGSNSKKPASRLFSCDFFVSPNW